jgi:redox-sensing transcriptional repressor
MTKNEVPDVVVQRIPLYLRTLSYVSRRDVRVISSRELADLTGVSPAQVRKDLSLFGEFGRQGLGYDVQFLRSQLQRVLQVDREWAVMLVGAGALGHALINYRTFEVWNYRMVAVFDGDPTKVGQPIGHLHVQAMSDMRSTVAETGAQIGIIAIPPEHAQAVAEDMVTAGIRAILNYASIQLVLPEGVRVAYIDPVVSLQGLTYYL